MENLLAARLQMALSLGFHIIFACIGIGMPLLMVIAEGLWLKTKNPAYLELAKRWAKGTAIMFAIGAVSGTVLSFELGLLWPRFMEVAGPVFGMSFALEGYAFFLEAIFLGIYMYGWKRVSPRAHWLSGVVVAVSGALSGIFVVTANAWMNMPQGFNLDENGRPIDIEPFVAMFNPASFSECLHMTVAAYVAVGFLVAGVHAYMLLKNREAVFHRLALGISLSVGGVAAVLMPLTGDISAKHVAEHQPVKFAAMEGHWETETQAPLIIGGLPDEEAEETPYAIEVPAMLSVLAHMDPDAEVQGLKDFPKDVRPPVVVVHIAFQIMVGCGMAMMLLAMMAAFIRWRTKRLPDGKWFLRALVLAAPLGMIAVEAGWTVTEVGRQPWVIRGVMRTSEAVTPMEGLWLRAIPFALLYLVLMIAVIILLKREVFASPRNTELRRLGAPITRLLNRDKKEADAPATEPQPSDQADDTATDKPNSEVL